MTLRKDITGQKFGRWTVLHVIDEDRTGSKAVRYMCRCECGTERPVQYSNLVNGTSKSCGCLGNEIAKAQHTKHGMAGTRIFRTWAKMKQRCQNPNDPSYSAYGGRGIKVCDAWMEFQSFYDWAMSNGYQDNLTIDRINVNGNYEPSNCRWTTKYYQDRNTRRSVFIEYQGRLMNQSDWADEFGVTPQRVAFEILKREGKVKYGGEVLVSLSESEPALLQCESIEKLS